MLAGVILAGGKSSRMGQDKSVLVLPNSDQTLLEHCYQNLALVCDNNILISGPQHEKGIADIIPDCGPLSGIHAVIMHINRYHQHIDELLVVPVDMPSLGPDDYRPLLETGRKTHGLCAYSQCFLPLYIPLSSDVTHYLETALKQQPNSAAEQGKQRQYSLNKMLSLLQSIQVKPLENTQLDNINTPQQWQNHSWDQPLSRHQNDSE